MHFHITSVPAVLQHYEVFLHILHCVQGLLFLADNGGFTTWPGSRKRVWPRIRAQESLYLYNMKFSAGIL